MDNVSRRALLGAAGMMAFQHEVAAGPLQEPTPKNRIKFAVIGLDHNHINGITDAIRRGGGELVAVYSNLPQAVAGFQKRYAAVKVARSEDEILNDPSIQLVCSASVPNLRAPLGVRVMRHGKDFLVDKPAITTLEQQLDAIVALHNLNVPDWLDLLRDIPARPRHPPGSHLR